MPFFDPANTMAGPAYGIPEMIKNPEHPARVLELGQPRDYAAPLFEGDVQGCCEYVWGQSVEVRRKLVVMSSRWVYDFASVEASRPTEYASGEALASHHAIGCQEGVGGQA